MFVMIAAAGCHRLKDEDRFYQLRLPEEKLRQIEPLDLAAARRQNPPAPAEPNQPPATVTISLEECRALALENNLDIQASLIAPPSPRPNCSPKRPSSKPLSPPATLLRSDEPGGKIVPIPTHRPTLLPSTAHNTRTSISISASASPADWRNTLLQSCRRQNQKPRRKLLTEPLVSGRIPHLYQPAAAPERRKALSICIRFVSQGTANSFRTTQQSSRSSASSPPPTEPTGGSTPQDRNSKSAAASTTLPLPSSSEPDASSPPANSPPSRSFVHRPESQGSWPPSSPPKTASANASGIQTHHQQARHADRHLHHRCTPHRARSRALRLRPQRPHCPGLRKPRRPAEPQCSWPRTPVVSTSRRNQALPLSTSTTATP